MGSRSALIVPVKRGNRPEGPRGGKGGAGDTEPLGGKATEPPTSDTVFTRLQRIAELAREDPERAFRSLAHHIDLELLHEAFRRTRKDGAVGVDGQTGREYEERLEENLRSLLDRFKSGQYKAPPVRRTYVPKGDGTQLVRLPAGPLGAPRAGRPLARAHGDGRGLGSGSGHQELFGLDFACPASWHSRPEGARWRAASDDRQVACRRRDGGDSSQSPRRGHPARGSRSPLLANIYLHEVIDRWFERDVKPRLVSRAFMVRFADDLVMVFASERDARRVWDVLPKQLGRYGLTLHPTKTRLLEFRPRAGGTTLPTNGDKGSFDLLGFTHYWARSRRGSWVVKRKTAGSRFGRAVKRVYEWCRTYRHAPVPWQHEQLGRKLRGHDNYYGITGNRKALARFRHEVRWAWRTWLNRRSAKARMTWERFERLVERYPLPAPVVRHWLRPRAANP